MRVLILFALALAGAFALDSPVANAVRSAPGWLPDAASRITWIGNTAWQFTTLAILMPAFALARPDPRSAARARRLLRVTIACFLLILLTGIAVQVLKHGFGRPRPDSLPSPAPFAFAPFSFQSGWRSFPSGHSTTMGALAVLACWVSPRIWPLAWGVAGLVGVSRVLVSKHYPSDVVAGLTLGAVLAIWLLRRWRAAGLIPAPGRPFRLPAPGVGPVGGLADIPRGFGAMLAALPPRR